MMMAITPNRAPPVSSTEVHDGLAVVSHARQAQAEQHGEQQHLQDFALGECIDHGIGNDVEQEADNVEVRSVDVGCDRLAVQGGRIDVKSGARLNDMRDDQADKHGNRGHYLKIHDGLDADPPDLLGVGKFRDPDHHGYEHDRGDDHPHQLDEGISERLHLHRERRPEIPERRAEHDTEQNLDVQSLR